MNEQPFFGSIGGNSRCVDPLDDLIQRLLVRELDRKVTQADRVRGRRRCTLSLPGVQTQVVMVAARRDERHAEGFGHAHHIEANDAMIEVHRFLDVADMDVNMPHAGPRGDGLVELVILLEILKQCLHIQRLAAAA